MLKKIKETAKKIALKNAAQHNGKASKNAVLGSVLGSLPEAKKDVPAAIKIIEQTIQDINNMSQKEQQKEINTLKISTEKTKKQKELLKDLPGVEKTVVMRFAPNPNGPLSLGHSRQALLNWHYTKKYKGKYILRLDDTDPKIKTPIKEAYGWITEDLKWLGINPDKIICASSRFQTYYSHAEKLIAMGKAYVCTCPKEKFAELKKNAAPCPCRSLDTKEHQLRWKKMFRQYKEGEAVLRIKTDIKHKNPAIRDWPAAR
ncbi:MAG: glutamate--tRNA ligase family protein, partial [archaeon]|nr:glutamate--tRNA ligase family protein [archaeon]